MGRRSSVWEVADWDLDITEMFGGIVIYVIVISLGVVLIFRIIAGSTGTWEYFDIIRDTVLCVQDVVTDICLIVQWFSLGHKIWGSLMLSSILLGGLVTGVLLLGHKETFEEYHGKVR